MHKLLLGSIHYSSFVLKSRFEIDSRTVSYESHQVPQERTKYEADNNCDPQYLHKANAKREDLALAENGELISVWVFVAVRSVPIEPTKRRMAIAY